MQAPRGPGRASLRTLARRVLSWLRRRWLLWLVLVAFLALVISRRVEIGDLAATLRRGQWQWIVVAVALEAGYYLLYARLYNAAFAVVGVASHVWDLLPAVFASVFLNTLAPTAGLTSAAVLVGYAVQRGQSGARAAEGVLLETVAENLAVLPILLVGLGYLLLRHVLEPYEVLGAAIFLLYVAALALLLGAARWRSDSVRRLLSWVQDKANRLSARLARPGLFPAGWAESNAAALRVAATAIVVHPTEVARMLGIAFAQQLTNLAALEAMFAAFQHPVGLGTLCAGYGLGYVFAILLFIPLDVAATQGIMIVVYDSLGVPAATAVITVLAFGGLNTWLPVIAGVLFVQRLRPPQGEQREDRGS